MAAKFISLLVGLTLALPTFAEDYRGGGRNGPPNSPPPQATQACRGSASNDSCSFNALHGTVSGSCLEIPGSSELVCVPADRNGNGSSSDGPQSYRPQQPQVGNGTMGQQPTRMHYETQSNGLAALIPATDAPIAKTEFETEISGSWRIIKANGIAEHQTGHFPNHGNPNAIKEQFVEVKIPAAPTLSGKITPLEIGEFGWALNGVAFDPGAAEYYKGNRTSGWQYEALSGAVALGIDENHAHVQPNGKYHYHGLPTMLLEDMQVTEDKHSPLIGWAADGFPIYALYGHQNPSDLTSNVVALRSSYRLKSGNRPNGADQPGGVYDGTFVADYQYGYGLGDLDECNGRVTVTPEFPEGTYAYFLTNDWPVIPRCHKGTSINTRRR